MTTISELTYIMQEEYPQLTIVDEDIFQGEPALTATGEDYTFAYWVEDDIPYMFFEEYTDESQYKIELEEEIETSADFYQITANFISWITRKTRLDNEIKETLSVSFLKPLKKQGYRPEANWDAEDYLTN